MNTLSCHVSPPYPFRQSSTMTERQGPAYKYGFFGQCTSTGAQIKKLAKSEDAAVAAAAKEVVESWKDCVKRDQAAEQAAADLRRTTSGAAPDLTSLCPHPSASAGAEVLALASAVFADVLANSRGILM